MEFFYYDRFLKIYEDSFDWDKSLEYLECLYLRDKSTSILNSLIGFSWYYLIEGSVNSKKYADDPNVLALKVWKKYIDIGEHESHDDPYFNFIAGYTLSLHGFYISSEYEKKGFVFMNSCLKPSNDSMLRQLADNFLANEKSTKYKPLEGGKQICSKFFCGDSLLDSYFNELYAN